MVAKITTPSSISKALNYNEKKVQKGIATCLFAGNFLKDAAEMNFYDKLNRFKDLISLNTRAKTNTLHISLNFHPSEKINGSRLIQIASMYMERIGFDGQPYLVYEHMDAGHPHIHIVTTCIRENGKRIVTQNMGRVQSEMARKEIEKTFGLVKASRTKTKDVPRPENAMTQKIRYGKGETKSSIIGVLNTVINRYQYTSIHELNAVLKLYNLAADRGTEDSRMYRNEGLVYRILDERGNKVSVPIKASSIPFKPTLKYLQAKFSKGKEGRNLHKQKLKTAIDFIISLRPKTLEDFVQRLKAEKVLVDLRKNKDGMIYGITFIDQRTFSVFKGSDIGKGYSIVGIQKRLEEQLPAIKNPISSLLDKRKKDDRPGKVNQSKNPEKSTFESTTLNAEAKETFVKLNEIVNDLLRSEQAPANIPYGFRKKKKKKRGFNL